MLPAHGRDVGTVGGEFDAILTVDVFLILCVRVIETIAILRRATVIAAVDILWTLGCGAQVG